ncbi:MAG: PLP-dependent aminotransferase family protein [Gammaproteobacteria bacterium]|nr:PLP-dependent aminotransferase family protein [Gammaproteobacteria bacterium]
MPEIPHDFGVGRSDPGTFPTESIKAAALAAIDTEAVELNNYPGSLGHSGFRAVMARRESEREGVGVDPDHIVVTNGSMQAVTLCAEALQQQPGDTVIVEEFSYPGTLSAYRSLKLDMVGIPLDGGGMKMDALEDALVRLEREQRRPRFIYAISTYQNPTGFVMPRARRMELIEIARRFGVPVVEDNCYGDVHYEGPVEPSIYALDDDPNHIYLCSLSKILAPGFRLGYILARPPMLETILARRHDAGSNYFASAVVAEFYRDGIAAHAAVTTPPLRRKRDLLCALLEANAADICAWSEPPGGLFIWVRLPADTDLAKLYSLALSRGVNYLPGSDFHYRAAEVPYLRLAFGHLPDTSIETGVPILARCIREARTSNEPVDVDSLF